MLKNFLRKFFIEGHVAPRLSESRKALSIGIRYQDLQRTLDRNNSPIHSLKELRGTHRDSETMEALLTEKFGYKRKDITILRDDGRHELPTRANILRAMSDLVRGARTGDHLVFHFSGHGSQVKNYDGSEDDGMDEAIWPSDVVYDPNAPNGKIFSNFIIDDHLKDILVNQLRHDVHMTIIMDCCHSGTGVDLDHVHSPDRVHGGYSHLRPNTNEDNRSQTLNLVDGFECKLPYVASTTYSEPAPGYARATLKQTSFNDEKHTSKSTSKHVTSWSACMDGQVGYESPKGGLLTQSLDKLLREKAQWTYEELLYHLSFELERTTEEVRQQYGLPLTCPRPQLGSLLPTSLLLGDTFTL